MGVERWTDLASHHMRQNYILALQSIFLLVESIIPVVDRQHSLEWISLPIITFLLLLVVWLQQYLLLSRPGTMKLSKNTVMDRIFIDDLPKSMLLCCTAFFVTLFQSGINELRQELLVGNFLLHGFDEYGASFVPIAISGVVLSLTLVSLHLLDQTSLASVQPTISTNFELEGGSNRNSKGEMQHPTAITEWRYIVSNLSHDMKTPLSALISGVDCLHDILLKLKHGGTTANPTSGPCNSNSFAHELCSVEDIVSSMGSTCFFMNMMINRAIDYTKISHHIPLVPFLEYVDVQESIHSCVHCINVLQSRVDIHVGPLPTQFQSQIVTDKQWFQENLTCLLSNAIKYTPDGRVDVFFEWMEHPGTSASLLKVIVEDMGIGVTVDAARTIFTHDPIDRSLTAGGGAGLGLYTLAKRVDTIGGVYGLSMRPDKLCGSVFWFAIPYVPVRMPVGGCASRPSPPPPLAIGDALKSDSETRAAALTTTGAASVAASAAASRTSVAPLLSTGSVKSDAKSDGSRCSLPPLHLQLPCTTRRVTDGPLNDAKTPRVMPLAAASSQCPLDASLYTATGCGGDLLLSDRPLRILVVDDAMPILKIIRRMLEKAGHFVLEAVNGQDALDIVQSSGTRASTALDLVLMDIQMPIMDGIDAARSMRAWETAMRRDTRDIAAIAATTNDEDLATATLTQVVEGDERRISSHSDALSLSLSPARGVGVGGGTSSSPSSVRYAAETTTPVGTSTSTDDAQLRRSVQARRWSVQSAIAHSRAHLDRVLQRNQPATGGSAGGGVCDLAGLPLDDERVIRAAAEACARDLGACNGVMPTTTATAAAAAESPVQLSSPLRLVAPTTPPEMERTYRERFRASRFAADGSTRSTILGADGTGIEVETPTPPLSTHRLWIIGCSANSDAGTVAEAMAAGMDAFLPKPVTVKSLHLLLHQLRAADAAAAAEHQLCGGDAHTEDGSSARQ